MHSQLTRNRRKGSAVLEFTLVGIPLMFLFISTEEMARAMWQYHTLQYAVKMANSYASVHGATCASPNSCSVDVSDIVGVFKNYAAVIPMSQVNLTLTSENSSVSCSPVSTCSSNASWGTAWPPSSNNDNAVGNWIKIRAVYTFNTALAMLYPGVGVQRFSTSGGVGTLVFGGYSYQLIQF
jgi:Flp pilus assembly protein TadG